MWSGWTPDCPNKLLVRARLPLDILNVFPTAKVHKTPASDYRYRAVLTRAEVAEVIAQRVRNIDYTNFKDSIHDEVYHAACFDVWATMHRLQK